jgi:hydroxypyruvate reductase
MRSEAQLIADAGAIWRAGVAAVDSRRLVQDILSVDAHYLTIGDHRFRLADLRRLIVVGAGKAGAGMARGVLDAVSDSLHDRVFGWVNVPDDCVAELPYIHLHAARPAGLNEPTERGQLGAQKILALVSEATADDLVLCLISGGGSALVPLPVDGVSLAEKQLLTQSLSDAGATIEQLNTVRKHLSRIKGGRLASACRAPTMISLIISDVMGDPLDMIASGMTIPDTTSSLDALDVMRTFQLHQDDRFTGAIRALQHAVPNPPAFATQSVPIVIGNNAVAVDAAGIEAERLGYSHAMTSASKSEGQAEDVGRHLARMAISMRDTSGPDCLISGGEPVVQLAPIEKRGKGGRNQQLCLAALEEIGLENIHGICLLSGGTDGEDGPTDAAGARIDAAAARIAKSSRLAMSDYLLRNDAYQFFTTTKSLILTGPTHTNVCDLRVVVVNRVETLTL